MRSHVNLLRVLFVIPWVVVFSGCGPGEQTPDPAASQAPAVEPPVPAGSRAVANQANAAEPDHVTRRTTVSGELRATGDRATGEPATGEPATGDRTTGDRTTGDPALAGLTWPNWMGANHDGISQEPDISTNWPVGGLPEVWSSEIGIGFSSVSIVGGQLFTMGHVGGEEFVYCLNADTGKEIWSHKYPCELVDNLYEGGPGSTPTVDGDFVYSLGKTGQLFCFRRADGKIVWQKELQDDLDIALPEWGFNSSPYILNEQLLLEGGRVVSYHKTTGEKIWQTDRHQAGYGSVAVFKRDGRTLVATLDCDGLRVVQATGGRQVAFEEWTSPFRTNSTTPIVRDGQIFISTGYNVGCALFRLEGDSLQHVYSNRDMRNHFNNSILVGDYLYGIDGNSNLGRVVRLTCMNFQTGEVAWQHRGLGCGSLMAVGGKLLVLSDDGDLVVAAASPDGFEELARSAFLEGRCWTVPVLLNGRIYGRNARGRLTCVQLPAPNG